MTCHLQEIVFAEQSNNLILEIEHMICSELAVIMFFIKVSSVFVGWLEILTLAINFVEFQICIFVQELKYCAGSSLRGSAVRLGTRADCMLALPVCARTQNFVCL